MVRIVVIEAKADGPELDIFSTTTNGLPLSILYSTQIEKPLDGSRGAQAQRFYSAPPDPVHIRSRACGRLAYWNRARGVANGIEIDLVALDEPT